MSEFASEDKLDGTEKLIRAFFRDSSQEDILDSLIFTDFQRRKKPRTSLPRESGISFWRLSKLSEHEIAKRILQGRKPIKGRLMGLAACCVEDLEMSEVKFSVGREHVSLFCPECNLLQSDPFCAPEEHDSQCSIMGGFDTGLSIALAELFEVTTKAKDWELD